MTQKKKILLTGGAGYIGAHTAVELIRQGFDTVLIDNFSKSDQTLLKGIEKIVNQKINFYEGDCCDGEFLDSLFSKNKFDSVIHFAAYKSVKESVLHPLKYYENNLRSLTTLLAAMDKHKVNEMIFSSSCTVYGQPDIIPVDENAPLKRAESPYGATKQMCERMLEDAVSANKNLKVVSLRYFNPIGAHPSALIGEMPTDVPDNLVPYVTQTAAGIRQKLTVFGDDYPTPDGSCLRDFIHVVDLAQAHVKAVERINELPNRMEYLNLGTGEGVSVLQLIKKFIEVTGVKLNYEIGTRRPGDVVKTYADASKAYKLLGWKTQLSLEEALKDAWRWQKKISV
ncbi:MAG: UDP-glucose 4-epimerase GalE [Bacteroidetes bacterium]|nr:UDP-glucose 4-epimerase GalE [Bacteroidota bacterium]MBS1539932.1 UDP-glucose 4-epimerase GalE [Bacteroidota bacterium]